MRKRTKFILYLIGLVIVSTLGYSMLGGEEWTLVDSLYMTVIALTTVGFGEVHTLSAAGRIWTIMVIVFGVTGLSVFLSSLGTDFIEFKRYRKRSMKNKISKLQHHYIICGYGRTGKYVSHELFKKGVPFVVIDNKPEKLEEIREHGFLHLEGNAMLDETLYEAGIDRAKGLVITLDSDQDNLYVTMSARTLNKDAYIISRCIQPDTKKMLQRAGADKVVNPYIASGQKIAELLLSPQVEDSATISTPNANIDLLIEQFKIDDMASLDGIMIKDSRLREDFRLMVVGLLGKDGDITLNPDPHTVLESGQTIMLIGSEEDLARFKQAIFE